MPRQSPPLPVSHDKHVAEHFTALLVRRQDAHRLHRRGCVVLCCVILCCVVLRVDYSCVGNGCVAAPLTVCCVALWLLWSVRNTLYCVFCVWC